MKKSIRPSAINGTLCAPASKSMLQRAIAAAVLSAGNTTILNATFSNDAKAAVRIAQALGAKVTIDNRTIRICGGLKPTGDALNCGEAGLSIRMFAPIAALWHEPLTLTGEGSLLSRPLSMVEAPLRQLGCSVQTSEGFPPLTVKGPLKGGKAVVDGTVSSQVLTGLLMALPAAANDSILTVDNLKSTPYIDMTLALLERFGVLVEHADYKRFIIKGNQAYKSKTGQYAVEGDWSGASFPLVAGAVGGSVRLTGLDIDSPQADREIMTALERAGAKIAINGNVVEVQKTDLKAFELDATDCPDLFPPLVALACNCSGTTKLTGVERLTHKESNRADALMDIFSALGGVLRVKGNLMEIEGGKLKGGTIDSHNDHRIAMTAALAAINAESEVIIQRPECVAKSYPDFYEDFAALQVR
ncbi:MAG: 3-phosphoshikimate 1-carboxyvinyltransferase [bacterium]|nr:3-phosphoshikimate 1-carboxyvinyltransferase [bacterium]